MVIAELKRVEESQDGTIGVLLIEKEVQCFILENRSWQNKPFVSCIPPGVYVCKRITSPNHGVTFEVQDVPGRSGILFHIGNISENTEGCLLTGRRVGCLNGKRAVLDSVGAFRDFIARLSGVDEFKLVVTENF